MSRQPASTLLAALVVTVSASCARPESLTPEAARAKGDGLVKRMSQTLSTTQAFSYIADEERDRVGAGGKKVEDRVSRRVTIRRPDSVAFTATGGDRNGAGWYDGKALTLVSHPHKAWARGPMPPTLDEAIDFLHAEYALPLPTGDLLYSNPYEALMTADTTGGWVDAQRIGDRTCDHVSYRQELVDWELWLTQDGRALPCQFQVTYKKDPGPPVTRVTFSDWNTSPAIAADTFAAKVPEGYHRIKIMRHATVVDDSVGADVAKPAGASRSTPARKPQ